MHSGDTGLESVGGAGGKTPDTQSNYKLYLPLFSIVAGLDVLVCYQAAIIVLHSLVHFVMFATIAAKRRFTLEMLRPSARYTTGTRHR